MRFDVYCPANRSIIGSFSNAGSAFSFCDEMKDKTGCLYYVRRVRPEIVIRPRGGADIPLGLSSGVGLALFAAIHC
jgi:hypothetical protein